MHATSRSVKLEGSESRYILHFGKPSFEVHIRCWWCLRWLARGGVWKRPGVQNDHHFGIYRRGSRRIRLIQRSPSNHWNSNINSYKKIQKVSFSFKCFEFDSVIWLCQTCEFRCCRQQFKREVSMRACDFFWRFRKRNNTKTFHDLLIKIYFCALFPHLTCSFNKLVPKTSSTRTLELLSEVRTLYSNFTNFSVKKKLKR